MTRIIYAVLATLSGLVLLLSYRTSLEAVAPSSDAGLPASSSGSTPTPAGTSAAPSPTPTSESSTSTSEPSTSTSEPSTSSSGLSDGTYTGDAVSTRYGPVQVQITVAGGVITDVQVPQYPNSDRRDRQINESALPILISETTQSQSADVAMVSGATYTSQGYRQSLQSAIDQAQQ